MEPTSNTDAGANVQFAAGVLFGPTEVEPALPIGEIATVWLNSLTATPGSVLPFQAATIAWDVHADAGPLRVLLNGELVGLSGSRVVMPQSSSVYRIVARTPNATRELGRVNVSVDSRACVTYQAPNVLNALDRAWERGLEQSDKMSLTGTPRVSFADGRIHLRADISFGLQRLPGTGSGTIRASFRIGVADRSVVSADEDIDVDLRLPLHARLFVEAIIKAGLAEIEATAQVRTAIGTLATLIGFLGAAPEGSALVSARVVQDGSGIDGISFTACPEQPVERLVARGEVVTGTIEPRIASGRSQLTPPA